MKYKMIVADFDDTILHDDMTVSKSFIDAVKDYEALGGRFVVATGRMTTAILGLLKSFGFKGELLTYQGAEITDIESGELLDTTVIPNSNAVSVCKYLYENGIYHHIYSGNELIADKTCRFNELYGRLSGAKLVLLKEPLYKYLKNSRFTPVKILIMDEPETVIHHIKNVSQKFGSYVNVNTSKNFIVEIINKNINKGIAVAKIAKKYNILQNEIICIGDSLNDYSMIEYAGLGVAVKNAQPEILEIADYIAPSNNDDGVAYIIRKFGIEEK